MPDKYKKIIIKKDGIDTQFIEKTSDKVEVLDIKELQIEREHILFKLDGLNQRLAEIDKALK